VPFHAPAVACSALVLPGPHHPRHQQIIVLGRDGSDVQIPSAVGRVGAGQILLQIAHAVAIGIVAGPGQIRCLSQGMSEILLCPSIRDAIPIGVATRIQNQAAVVDDPGPEANAPVGGNKGAVIDDGAVEIDERAVHGKDAAIVGDSACKSECPATIGHHRAAGFNNYGTIDRAAAGQKTSYC
jgi:hypothetical protein